MDLMTKKGDHILLLTQIADTARAYIREHQSSVPDYLYRSRLRKHLEMLVEKLP